MGPTWGVSNFFVLLVLALCGMPGRAQVSEGTHSPHGTLTVPLPKLPHRKRLDADSRRPGI